MMNYFKKIIDEKILKDRLEDNKQGAESILTDKDKVQSFLNKVLEKAGKVPALGQYLEEIPLLCNMVLDYIKKRYDKFPRTSIITITAALLYFLSPVDILPDFVVGLGFIDDAFIIKLALDGVHHDISEYKKWKESMETVYESESNDNDFVSTDEEGKADDV
jgi:uncharacterized membrane protein YkvA (DUF1232 family)